MADFYVADSCGLRDMRRLHGPFADMKSAIRKANKMPFPHNEAEWPAVGNWYAVHPFGGMVDGPYETQLQAEKERLANINDEQVFEIACSADAGFTARVVYIAGGTYVLERAAAVAPL
jgi:hypothetical protein